jgi:hypothetical protein
MSTYLASPMELPAADFATILFTTTLQESERPEPWQVYAAVRRCLDLADRDHCVARALARLAQEAGDHPEETVRRMRWALRTAYDMLLDDVLATAS